MLLRRLRAVLYVVALVCTPAIAAPKTPSSPGKPVAANGFDAEARLIHIYQRIGQAQTREALKLADQLVKDHPNFALAQLVHGDLLNAQTQPLKAMGDMPEATARAAPGVLGELREESILRLKALKDRPPPGLVPAQFVRLSARNKHAIAIDASRSRLYVFENTPNGLRLQADYYISVGKLGIEKVVEGDLRTPLGIYFITNTLPRKTLKDLYGAGALPINYPNPYDMRRGKTGSGIWLHGVPRNQFARAPKATDGCVALSNPDLERILATVQIRTTPVVIAPSLQWVSPAQSNPDVRAFEEAWSKWRAAKANTDLTSTVAFYTSDFNNYGKTLADWTKVLQTELSQTKGHSVEAKDVSVLYWAEKAQAQTMVVTFSEVRAGRSSGSTKRQYWLRSPAATQNEWKIFFEGVIG
jgi:L,D-transpeptidase YnhG